MDNNPKLKDAQEAQRREEFAEALKLYEEIIKVSPQLAEGYAGAAYYLYYLQKYNEALEMSNTALGLNPTLIIPHVIKAYVFDIYEDKEKSRREAKIAYDLDPNSFDALLCYGTMLVFDEQFDNAIEVLEKAVV